MKYVQGYIVGAASGLAYAVDPDITLDFITQLIGAAIVIAGLYYFRKYADHPRKSP